MKANEMALPIRGLRDRIASETRHPHQQASASPVTASNDEWRLVEAARSDPQAFAPLYERYVDLVWRYAMSRLRDPERAADATSITFQRALAALPKFQPEQRTAGTTFRAWLMTIAHNAIIDELRRRPVASLDAVTDGPWLIDQQRSPEERAIASDEQRHVLAALDQLPEIPRQIVELRLYGLRVAEIANMLGMTESAVKTAHHRAYTRLRHLLASHYHQDDHS